MCAEMVSCKILSPLLFYNFATTTIHSLEEGGHSILPIYPVLQCFQMVQLGLRRFLLNSFGETLRDTSGNTMSENA